MYCWTIRHCRVGRKRRGLSETEVYYRPHPHARFSVLEAMSERSKRELRAHLDVVASIIDITMFYGGVSLSERVMAMSESKAQENLRDRLIRYE